MIKKKSTQEISHVKRREIQAPVVTKIINGFIEQFGKEDTLKVLSKVIKKDAIESGSLLSEKFNGNNMHCPRMINLVFHCSQSC